MVQVEEKSFDIRPFLGMNAGDELDDIRFTDDGHLEILSPNNEDGIIKRTRLLFSYLSAMRAEQATGKKYRLLDIGTYDGFAISLLSEMAQYVFSIDGDEEKLVRARKRPEVAALIEQGRVKLINVMAQDIDKDHLRGTFNIITLIDVMVGFDGTMDDMAELMKLAHELLAPGGSLYLNVESRTGGTLLTSFQLMKDKPKTSIVVHHAEIAPILADVFGAENVTWSGQMVWSTPPEGGAYLKPEEVKVVREHGNHGKGKTIYAPSFFMPRTPIDIERETPTYWLARCQKEA